MDQSGSIMVLLYMGRKLEVFTPNHSYQIKNLISLTVILSYTELSTRLGELL